MSLVTRLRLNLMPSQSELKKSALAMRSRGRVVKGEKTNLRTGSMAPTEPSTVTRKLIGNEVRRLRRSHGHSVFFLEAGDALLLDAAVHHGPEGLVQVPIQYLSIIIYPRET